MPRGDRHRRSSRIDVLRGRRAGCRPTTHASRARRFARAAALERVRTPGDALRVIRTLGIDGRPRRIGGRWRCSRSCQPGTASQLDRSGAGGPLGEAPVRADERAAARTRMRTAGRISRTSCGVASPRALSCTRRPTSAATCSRTRSASFRTAVELDLCGMTTPKAQPRAGACSAYGPTLFPSNAPDTGGARGQKSGQGRAGSG